MWRSKSRFCSSILLSFSLFYILDISYLASNNEISLMHHPYSTLPLLSPLMALFTFGAGDGSILDRWIPVDLHGEGRRRESTDHAVDIYRRKVKVKRSGVERNMMPIMGHFVGRGGAPLQVLAPLGFEVAEIYVGMVGKEGHGVDDGTLAVDDGRVVGHSIGSICVSWF